MAFDQTAAKAEASAQAQAAKAGNMAAIGVARLNDERLLQAAGADIVVTSLDDVARDSFAQGRLEQRRARA